MNLKRVGAVLLVLGAGGVVGMGVGCGASGGTGGVGGTTTSSTTDTGTTTASTTGSTVASTSSGGSCPVPSGDTATDCASMCKTLWDCGEMATCNAGSTQLCPGFAPMGSLMQTQWTSSCTTACGQLSASQMTVFFGTVDPTSCANTITQVSAASATTGMICQQGHA